MRSAVEWWKFNHGGIAMNAYKQLSPEQRAQELGEVRSAFEAYKAKKLQLNMARGKPGAAQLDLVRGLFTALSPDDLISDGIDARNYGQLSGLPEAKRLFAEILGCKPEQCFVGGNASLQLMYDVVCKGFTHGLPHSPRPWSKEETVKWLCPVPGYDRHFKITQCFGFEMINVPMLPTGPDVDMVEKLVQDPAVRGIWCVPKYSNPDGIVYSDETIRRIAALRPAAPDFTVIWDNAYCIHEFEGEYVPFPDVLSLCAAQGNADMVFEFASTSKVTLPGGGISVMATSEANLRWYEKLAGIGIISYDKVNQLRHVRYLKNKENTLALMKKHAEVLRPKFRCVLDTLQREIAPLGLAEWQTPKGGYFISLNTLPGLAKRTLALCAEAGVVMTPAGATYPCGKDPQDRSIRIAPSYPDLNELKQAIDVFCICLRLAALEQLA